MNNTEIFENLQNALVDGEKETVKELCIEGIKLKIDPLELINESLSKGMEIVGENFENGDIFLPELIRSANIFEGAMEVLQPELEAQKKEVKKVGKVLIATVKGDVHSIGKNIVMTIFKIHGYEMVDMGIDIPTLKIIETAEKEKVDVIALSSLMTTTMPMQKELIDELKNRNLRDKYFVIIGGGPVTQKWADEIEADGLGESPVEGVNLVKKLLSQRG